MIKQTLTAAALAAVLATPAFAQQQPTPSANTPMLKSDQVQAPAGSMNRDQKVGFVQTQSAHDWRGSELIGATIYGPDNNSIGEVNDVLIGDNGEVKAVILGVGGFLGVGEKDVAIPFSALNVQRKADAASIEKITVSYSKDELKNAPTFAYYDADKAQTTGAGSKTRMMNDTKPMKK